jgi:hypothetical protein
MASADIPAAHARLSYAKVAEYQRRDLVHFHAVIRADRTSRPVPGRIRPTGPSAAT